MRFVPVKTAEQQATQLLHRGREQLVRQRTMLVNALRAHLAEFGMVAAQGLRNVGELIAIEAPAGCSDHDEKVGRRGRRAAYRWLITPVHERGGWATSARSRRIAQPCSGQSAADSPPVC